ncbi:MAG TPA: hypothetical protein VJ624_09755 [Thermodesulfobacteriota bacterium]|nr:hypothetical protein [Thermodesulfobacteriota bacterium]
MKNFMCKIIFLVIVFSSFSHHVSAQIYKYQDKDGKIYFTSDPNAIPEGGKILKAFETQEGNKNNPQEENLPENYSPDMEPTIQVLQTVLQLYHATHTYSETDFFVCADMAVDVWNMVKTKGINARIAAGNVDKPHADWKEFNHAWVVAEAAPRKWIALETTGGNLVSRNKNKNYYRGYFFTSPRELKEYSERYRQGNELLKRTKTLQGELKKVQNDYDQELKKYNEMVDEYNKKYPNRLLALGQYKEAQASKEKINQQSTKVKEVEGRGKQLSELINSNVAELQTFEQALDKPIEILPSN